MGQYRWDYGNGLIVAWTSADEDNCDSGWVGEWINIGGLYGDGLIAEWTGTGGDNCGGRLVGR